MFVRIASRRLREALGPRHPESRASTSAARSCGRFAATTAGDFCALMCGAFFAIGFAIAVSSPLLAQDTTRVRADGPPRWGANVRVTREFAVGVIDGPEEYAFGRIDQIAGLRDGRFVVFDQQYAQLRLYDAAGKFVRNLGRKGNGPGEYEASVYLFTHGDSLLLVSDFANNRVTIFGVDGRFRRQFLLLRPPFYGAHATFLDAENRFYLRVPRGGVFREGFNVPTRYLRSDLTGRIIDSLDVPPDSASPRLFYWGGSTEGDRMSFPLIRVSAPSFSGGVVSARTAEYRFTVSQPGSPVLVVSRAHTPIPLTGTERDEWEAMRAGIMARTGRDRAVLDEIPRVKPAIRDLFTDTDGRIWLNVYAVATPRTGIPPAAAGRTRVTMREVATFDVFTSRGEFLGRVALPENCELKAVSGQRIWAVEEAPGSGEQRIVVFRINP